MTEGVPMTTHGILAWLHEDQGNVLEYSADLHRAYIQDEDGDNDRRFIPVTLARDLLSAGEIAVWRYIGQWNNGYHTYRPTAWVNEWKQRYPIIVEEKQG